MWIDRPNAEANTFFFLRTAWNCRALFSNRSLVYPVCRQVKSGARAGHSRIHLIALKYNIANCTVVTAGAPLLAANVHQRDVTYFGI